MTKKVLVVIGAGGFGRETLDVVEALNTWSDGSSGFRIAGVADRNPSSENLLRLEARGIAYLGTEQDVLESMKPQNYLVGIGRPTVRRKIAAEFDRAGWHSAIAVHPLAGIGSKVSIGAGSIICAGVQISSNVRLGVHVHLNPNSTVGHDSELDDFVSVNPGATISGDVSVGGGALIGANAVILQGLTIGENSTVGAGACVVRCVQHSTTVKGVPAK